jgi:hypothetical protein
MNADIANARRKIEAAVAGVNTIDDIVESQLKSGVSLYPPMRAVIASEGVRADGDPAAKAPRT